MNIKKLLVFINYILLIYSCNGFQVEDYNQAIKALHHSDNLKSLNELTGSLAYLKITYTNDTTQEIIGIINTDLVGFSSKLIKYIHIKSLQYQHKSNLITLDNIINHINFANPKSTISIVSSNADKLGNIDSVTFKALFADYRTIISNIAKEPRIMYTREQLETFFYKYTPNNFLDDFAIQGNYFNFYTNIELDNWYIVGHVNGSTMNKLEPIPLKYVSDNLSLYYFFYKTQPGYKKNYFLISITTKKFSDRDIGSYLIYCFTENKCKIVGLITKFITSSDSSQLLSINLLNNKIASHVYYYYEKMTSTEIDSAALSKSIQISSTLPANYVNHHSISEQSSQPITYHDKLNCEDINHLGIYSIINGVKLIVLAIESNIEHAKSQGIYNIQGSFKYDGKITNFLFCHKGSVDLGDYLSNTIDKELNAFYPYKPSHLVRALKRRQHLDSSEENSTKKIKLPTFNCESINTIGQHLFNENITIIVTSIESYTDYSEINGIYHIGGMYLYKGETHNFSYCHKGSKEFDDYLSDNLQGLNAFYPMFS